MLDKNSHLHVHFDTFNLWLYTQHIKQCMITPLYSSVCVSLWFSVRQGVNRALYSSSWNVPLLSFKLNPPIIQWVPDKKPITWVGLLLKPFMQPNLPASSKADSSCWEQASRECDKRRNTSGCLQTLHIQKGCLVHTNTQVLLWPHRLINICCYTCWMGMRKWDTPLVTHVLTSILYFSKWI